ncbi:hypothetical protein GIB67_025487 [Kingdonia uniflora]|uniref:TCP domain-containing protein n=1 Tax=Kingdonia uniflora TaxID=39325 RepID=A0A7J7PD52_9MAGN|nr:hypothetical protein GIB67_025487 [Kingdonia uniflora]
MGFGWQGLLGETEISGFNLVASAEEAKPKPKPSVVRVQKLEEEEEKRNLDPQRNPHYSHHHLQSHLHLHHQQENQENETEQEEQQQQHQGFHGLYQNLHQQSINIQQTINIQQQQQTEQLSNIQRSTAEYARLGERMGEPHHHQPSTRRSRGEGGEIIEVQGGHIVRSTGRKDRHSKVCTAKGPRDRRVRLSAHTAIQFYDVQDRLGYDRPSKAVDWLIQKAKASIDQLAELPPWHPTATTNTNTSTANVAQGQEEENVLGISRTECDAIVSSSERAMEEDQNASGYGYQHRGGNINDFYPTALDSDPIADTIKSFFPTVASTSSSINFQNYPPDLLSRTSSQSQDLRLSLQSFQDPMLLHHQSHQHSTPSSAPLGYETSTSWPEHHHQLDMQRFQRMVAWNPGGDTSGGGGGAFVFNSQPPPPPQPQAFSQNPFFSQRGTLQSSNTSQVRAWIDPSFATADQSTMSSIGFATGGFSGFRIPARIQGEEEHDGSSNKPPSTSRH